MMNEKNQLTRKAIWNYSIEFEQFIKKRAKVERSYLYI
jgi:hypothetical protein